MSINISSQGISAIIGFNESKHLGIVSRRLDISNEIVSNGLFVSISFLTLKNYFLQGVVLLFTLLRVADTQ